MQNVALWDKCLSKLEDEMEERDFHTWVRPLHASDSDSKLVLYAPNRFIKDWLMDNLMPQLIATTQYIGGEGISVSITLDPPNTLKSTASVIEVTNSDEENTPSTPFGTNISVSYTHLTLPTILLV